MLGLDRVVLPSRPLGLVARFSQLQLQGPPSGQRLLERRVRARQRRLDGAGGQDTQDVALDRLVDAQPAERDAPSGTVVDLGAAAPVPGDMPLVPEYVTWSRRPQCPHRRRPAIRLGPRRTAPFTMSPFICALCPMSARFRSQTSQGIYGSWWSRTKAIHSSRSRRWPRVLCGTPSTIVVRVPVRPNT